jgi:hypothetical protein
VLAIDRETLSIRPSSPGAVDQSELEIRPASPSIHYELANQFLETTATPGELAEKLKVLLEDRTAWWQLWTQELRTASPELSRQWLGFRRKGLEEALARTLVQNGFSGPQADVILTRVSEQQERRPPPPPATHSGQLRSAAGRARISADPDARILVQRVVAQMHQDELRSLRLPLGLVLDSLAE